MKEFAEMATIWAEWAASFFNITQKIRQRRKVCSDNFSAENMRRHAIDGCGVSLKNIAIFFLYFLKNGPIPASFCLSSSFPHKTNQDRKSIDGLLGTWTRGARMEGTNESTELWWHPNFFNFLHFVLAADNDLCERTLQPGKSQFR